MSIEDRIAAALAKEPASRGLQAGHPGQLTVQMPRIDLPAGVADTPILDRDRADARTLGGYQLHSMIRLARDMQRAARRQQRRATSRPAAKRARAVKEATLARDGLINAGIVCGAAEIMKADMTVTPERIARIRERCQERYEEEPGRYAVDLENWIRDLTGAPRLTKA